MFPTILIVDDEPSILQSLKGVLSDEGFEVSTASNGYEALKMIDEESPDLVLLDVWLPGIDGIDTLKEIKKDNPSLQVVIITGHGTIDTAVKATKLGAFDFLEKPLSIDKVIVAINNALNFRRLEEENRYLRKKTIEKSSLTGNSPAIMALKQQINIIAPTDAWVLISGENGTGKELVARTIHHFSPRNEYPMIDINCASIPDESIEHELFGYEKNAVPGAKTRKIGRFELANNGTVFFDEIGDMNINTQRKILRFMEEQKFQRVGGGRQIKVNVRVLSATNKNIEEEIKKETFREDLYYRLNVVPLRVPPLRERIEDIPILANTFLKEFASDKRKVKQLSLEVLDAFRSYNWPGNVREMRNLLGRLEITVEDSVITLKDIPKPYTKNIDQNFPSLDKILSLNSFKDASKEFEIAFFIKKFYENDQDISKTAKIIGVEKNYLQKIIKDIKHG